MSEDPAAVPPRGLFASNGGSVEAWFCPAAGWEAPPRANCRTERGELQVGVLRTVRCGRGLPSPPGPLSRKRERGRPQRGYRGRLGPAGIVPGG
ncbi:hypothetical protein FHS01_000056 [Longimicrobium terrae]|uniref:Uncharacterized protein n=1 Tax=Longimicrobium terrae TaxID=1639882 RepID=A0A841GPY3_9BACT|nr:hypothetical protein [Longimicrobium terrae]MBB6069060.1 hypothetical protein [Longimicrobium terrae]